MATTFVVANPRHVTPLVTISHSTFTTQYYQALHWYLTHEYDPSGPLFDCDIVKTFENFLGCRLFDGQPNERMYESLGTYLGIIHAGILSPQRTLRSDVTTLVRFTYPDVQNGYYAGREFYFLDAESDEERATTDTALLDMWQTIQREYDIGVNNLAAITSNKAGFVPLLVNGRPLKSVNHYYNKRKAQLQKKLGKAGTTHRMQRLTNKRNRRINHSLHTQSKRIIDVLVNEGIGTLVIGKNPEWKQEVDMGKCNNQNFVQIPHARFIDMLSYKAQLVGIRVIITEESYTSKCSFLDTEPIGKHDDYRGKRVKRGLFRTAKGLFVNADVNGSYNIIRKVAPKAFKGVEGLVVHPTRMTRVKQTTHRAS